MGEITYQPLRSLIYVDCVKEEYRHKLQHWLYYYHAPESIAKFEPWVTKYAFYNALPTPPQGERFGTYRMQLTEHYWMVNPMSQESLVNSLNEYFPIDAMIWQGTLPQNDIPKLQKQLNGRMTLMGGIDASIVDRVDSTEEEIRKEVRRACEEYAPHGHFIPCITYGGPGCLFPHVDSIIDDEIEKYNKEVYGI